MTNPYPSPRSVLVMDNAQIHHAEAIKDLVHGMVGIYCLSIHYSSTHIIFRLVYQVPSAIFPWLQPDWTSILCYQSTSLLKWYQLFGARCIVFWDVPSVWLHHPWNDVVFFLHTQAIWYDKQEAKVYSTDNYASGLYSLKNTVQYGQLRQQNKYVMVQQFIW